MGTAGILTSKGEDVDGGDEAVDELSIGPDWCSNRNLLIIGGKSVLKKRFFVHYRELDYRNFRLHW